QRSSKTRAVITAKRDEPPGLERGVIGNTARGLHEGCEFSICWCGAGDFRVRVSGEHRVADAHVSSGVNDSASEFMQYLSPVGVPKPSGNTWPRCEPQAAQRTSVRTMPSVLSSMSSTASG